MRNPTVLKDALHNLHPESGATNNYCQGLVVGIVAGMMSRGLTFQTAIKRVAENLPDKARPIIWPPSWKSDVMKYSKHKRKEPSNGKTD